MDLSILTFSAVSEDSVSVTEVEECSVFETSVGGEDFGEIEGGRTSSFIISANDLGEFGGEGSVCVVDADFGASLSFNTLGEVLIK